MLLNMDKVNTSTEMGEKEHVLGSAGRNRSARPEKRGTNGHVTTVLNTNAAGDIFQLHLIVEGHLEMKHWYDPRL